MLAARSTSPCLTPRLRMSRRCDRRAASCRRQQNQKRSACADRTAITAPMAIPAIAPVLKLQLECAKIDTHPPPPVLGNTVAIAVTVLIPPPPPVPELVGEPLVTTGATGVVDGDELSKHPLGPLPTVNRSLDPPIPGVPRSNAARINEVPWAILVSHLNRVPDDAENMNGCP